MVSTFTCIVLKLRVSKVPKIGGKNSALMDIIGGDASMELTMAAQEDSTPWELPDLSSKTDQSTAPAPSTSPTQDIPTLHGRSYFSALGLVRRKPSRPDAPPTLSKSCSDKLSLKQSTSLLSSLTSLFVSPQNCYINSLVIPSSQHSQVACIRAFSSTGRLAPLQGKEWDGGYAFKPFRVDVTETEFKYSRRQILGKEERIVSSNIAAFWTPNGSETLIGGTLQGRKQFSMKGASRVCKRRSWKLALDISAMISVPVVERCLEVESYKDMKMGTLLRSRRRVKEAVKKEALKGWVRNDGGEEWDVHEVES